MNQAATPSAVEVCDLCHLALAPEHQHLLEASTFRIECACDACAILFSGQGQKYRRVPRRIRYLANFRLNDSQWNRLRIPIGVAFLFHSSKQNKMAALYPSPAGPVESLLPLEAWSEIERENPDLPKFETDVEGLLVYRVGEAREHYLIPIDECFRLIGIIRTQWKGFSGGTVLWSEVAKFLEDLRRKSS